ncbi:hypothetical protein BRC72_01025 [Halobacteriales archaeon QH_7_66_36]|nr:MAG: hypothetical protein BRC72_01025 [Halobacteriales archaeon QH_7_66_36]
MTYSDADHPYNCRVPDDEIRCLLVELEKPWRSKRVLRYFHEERQYSTREIARLFNVARQTLQDVVRPIESFEFTPKYGRSYKVDDEQRTLGDFAEEHDDPSGLAEFI